MHAWMSWSSGKDSALALHEARTRLGLDVDTLLVTLNEEADRVAMHAVRASLLAAQAQRLDLRLHAVYLPPVCPNSTYEQKMSAAMDAARAESVERIVFGDLFLEDIRVYRERNLEGSGIAPVFPLWGRPTDQLARDMIDAGIRAVLTCVDPAAMPPEFAGRQFDGALLADLPEGVDPCGENGEFHTFVWDAPGFSSPIPITTGEIVERDGFVFCDVVAS
jgi:uncharacterized protein (TIGR00290 family)